MYSQILKRLHVFNFVVLRWANAITVQVATEPFYVAIITPVIHYCMGGLECTVDAECIDKTGKVIPGLYVAGEAAGGIHGNNRF